MENLGNLPQICRSWVHLLSLRALLPGLSLISPGSQSNSLFTLNCLFRAQVPNYSDLFIFFKIFFMWTFIFFSLYQIHYNMLLLGFFVLFWPQGMWDLSSLSGD